ncbi:MAG: Rsd/AlgQ family anti-sigma factor [Halieaceae bacterium]
MPNRQPDPLQQFALVDELLTRWLRERRALLASYTGIVVTLDSQATEEALRKRQQAFCELLVDYISGGHFEVFHELIDEAEFFGDGSNELAITLMPAIADTTEVIMAYEEKYGSGDTYPDTLERDLSVLGELLESRFVLEDQLIAGLHNTHRRQAESPAS